MISNSITTSVTAILALSFAARAAPQSKARQAAPELSETAQLQLADSAVNRYNLLPNDEDFVFDFNNSTVPLANRQTFPALVGTGGAIAVGTLEPCSMSFLHLHPRAAEIFGVTSGRVLTEMVAEGGAVDADGNPRVIRAELGANMITVFPQGAFHTQVNPDCEPATTFASFSSEDPGASGIASEAFALSNDVIARAFGKGIASDDIDAIRDAIPKGFNISLEECAAKCGIKKRQA